MLCCSPDFTQPDPLLPAREVEREKRMVELTAYFGGKFCRVLSGQRRPEVGREEGVARVVETLRGLPPFAQAHGVTLVMENHYKDNYWQFPEFAQNVGGVATPAAKKIGAGRRVTTVSLYGADRAKKKPAAADPAGDAPPPPGRAPLLGRPMSLVPHPL